MISSAAVENFEPFGKAFCSRSILFKQNDSAASVAKCRGSWVVGVGRGCRCG